MDHSIGGALGKPILPPEAKPEHTNLTGLSGEASIYEALPHVAQA